MIWVSRWGPYRVRIKKPNDDGMVGGEIGRGTYVKGDGRYPQPQAPRAFALGGQRDNGINLSMAVPPLGDGGKHLAKTLTEIAEDPALAAELVDYPAAFRIDPTPPSWR